MKKEEAPTSNTHHFLVDLNGQSTWVKIDDDRQQRRLCCGSTDVSKIMGTNQYDGQYELYHTKINDEVLEVNSAMRMGLLMEPIFRQLTQESLGDLGLDPDERYAPVPLLNTVFNIPKVTPFFFLAFALKTETTLADNLLLLTAII